MCRVSVVQNEELWLNSLGRHRASLRARSTGAVGPRWGARLSERVLREAARCRVTAASGTAAFASTLLELASSSADLRWI